MFGVDLVDSAERKGQFYLVNLIHEPQASILLNPTTVEAFFIALSFAGPQRPPPVLVREGERAPGAAALRPGRGVHERRAH